ncbi:protein tyrosine phosphatase-like domain-containing protein [Aspergillus undulatus]|uniref:protein tyrosine phosphatase-like domain-containing protein n=1 Tax=Aspergillus undulatus TaxID=1810928 RepID=UPI003CCCCABB
MSSQIPKLTPKGPSGITRQYLLFYNAANFFGWTVLTIRTVRHLINQSVTSRSLIFDIPGIFADTYSPLLQVTQSLALLEILHSLIGIVRAPVVTTTMQVASRIFVVWGVLYPFQSSLIGSGSSFFGFGLGKGGDGLAELAYLGCLLAWGVTEVIRYGFFTMQVNGGVETVPGWWQWLRYNMFYILYPIGISSEVTLSYKALTAAKEFHPIYWWFIVAVLAVYVPGSYVMYTHMIKQRRRTAAKEVKKTQ